jgi:large subunit ribosomal protein L1
MPNPKTGTVTFDVGRAIREIRQGKVEYRTDKGGIVHVSVGRVSFSTEQLSQNAAAVVESILRAKPATSKGKYVRRVILSSTMGPGIAVDAAGFHEKAA